MNPDKTPVITRGNYILEYSSGINTNNNVNDPDYKTGATIEDRQKANLAYIQQQELERQKQYAELEKILNEEQQEFKNSKSTNFNPFTSPQFLEATKSYRCKQKIGK